jgi:hypothetical protein
LTTTSKFGQELRLSRREPNAFEAIDRATDEVREVKDRWQNSLTVKRHSIAENYADGRLSLICDLNILAPDTRIDRDAGMDHCPLGHGEVLATAIFAVDRPDVRNVLLRDQEPMLVFNVESVQTPQGLAYRSLVRLYLIHDEVDDCFGGLMFQSTVNGVYKFIPGSADRKVSVRVSGPGCIEFNVAHHEIESDPEIMDRITDSEKHSIRSGFTRADLKDALSSLRIVLDRDIVRASVGELPRLSVKIVDVLVGPFDL